MIRNTGINRMMEYSFHPSAGPDGSIVRMEDSFAIRTRVSVADRGNSFVKVEGYPLSIKQAHQFQVDLMLKLDEARTSLSHAFSRGFVVGVGLVGLLAVVTALLM